MSREEFIQLEKLFGKLEGFIGKRICLISAICDGKEIGAYSWDGKFIDSAMSHDIESAAMKLVNKLTPSKTDKDGD